MSLIRVKPRQAPDLSLIAADAGPGTILLLAPGEYRVEQWVFEENVQLQGEEGAEATLLVGGGGRSAIVLAGEDNDMVLRGLTLRDGDSGNAGAVRVLNDNRLQVKDCRLLDNAADESGGAIALGGEAQMLAARCLFAGNKAMMGGAVAARQNAEVFVDRCIFADNEAQLGGAISMEGDGIITRIGNCTFTGNRATHPHGGGALYLNGTTSDGPEVMCVNSLLSGDEPIVVNPNHEALLRLAHTVLPPDTLEALPHEDEGGNQEVAAELQEVAPGLWGLAPGSPGEGVANAELIPDEAADILGRELVQDGQADPGAMARA